MLDYREKLRCWGKPSTATWLTDKQTCKRYASVAYRRWWGHRKLNWPELFLSGCVGVAQPAVHPFILTFLFWLIEVVFSNGTMLSMSDKYDSVNKRTQEVSESMKLHILGAWWNAHEIYRQLANYSAKAPVILSTLCTFYGFLLTLYGSKSSVIVLSSWSQLHRQS